MIGSFHKISIRFKIFKQKHYFVALFICKDTIFSMNY